jgi:hypothetical protein
MNSLGTSKQPINLTDATLPCTVVQRSEQPPAASLLRKFLVSQRCKLLVIGVAAVIAGMLLVGIDLFCVGLTIPLTLQFEATLFGIGGTAIIGCVAGLLMTPADQLPSHLKDEDRQHATRPRGKRCSTRLMVSPRQRMLDLKAPEAKRNRAPVITGHAPQIVS